MTLIKINILVILVDLSLTAGENKCQTWLFTRGTEGCCECHGLCC